MTGTFAIVAASSAGVVVVNIANPAAPQLLGSVATPGDARKVAVKGSAAFIADYPVSMQVVDFSTPSAPTIIAATSDPLGGKLQDVAVFTVAGSTFTFGADVYFVNGVPIVDVTQPGNPAPRAILSFAQFRDDNGHGIGVDGQYVYMTGEEGTITDLGATGNTRLYIGQYNQFPQDNFGIPPTISITSPVTGPLIQGQTILVSADATDDVAVASVTLRVNGQAIFTTAAPPYQVSYLVPPTATSLIFGGTAVDYGNNVGTAQNIQIQVIPDPGTTVTGRVVDGGGNPVGGATVSTLGALTATTASDGTFSITQAPTVAGNIQVTATFITPSGTTLAGLSITQPPVRSGITNVGTITVVPFPVVTSISPKSALAGSPLTMLVNGTTLSGATFAFKPPPASPIGIVATTNPTGSQATLNLTIPANSVGTFALVASNTAGNSGTAVTQTDRFTVVDPNSTADTDQDGFQDVIEAVFGTDPLDPSSFPVIPTAAETESVAFSLLNAPVTGAGIRESESIAFSLLNAPVTGAGIRESEGIAFSVLNAPVTGAGIRETESIAFSLLNAPVTGAAIRETESIAFSVLNAPTGNAGISEADAYFSVANMAVGVAAIKPQTANPSPSSANSSSEGNANSTQPNNPAPKPIDPLLDSDGDGLPDWFEILMGTDPNNPDTDGDGLTDFQEVFIYHTNPVNPDTDGDGFTDGQEALFGSDPLNPDSTPISVRRRASVARPGTANFASAAKGNGTKNSSTTEGDAHVKAHPKRQKRDQTGSRSSVSSSFVPGRRNR